jgi:hypothetical protein
MTLFIDTQSRVDREALREYALKKLTHFAQACHVLIGSSDNKAFWDQLHHQILSLNQEDKSNYLKIENQLTSLPNFIEGWIRMAVESEERFAFFIKSKAEEIKSGDEKKDYFWALQIRHDQIIGLLRVLETFIAIIETWVQKPPTQVINDGVFIGLNVHSLEEQIYLEAEKVKSEREKLI